MAMQPERLADAVLIFLSLAEDLRAFREKGTVTHEVVDPLTWLECGVELNQRIRPEDSVPKSLVGRA